MLKIILPLLISAILLCSSAIAAGNVRAVQYTLTASDRSGKLLETGLMTYNVQRNTITYELDSSGQRGWVQFEDFAAGAAQTLVHIVSASTNLTQVRLLSTPFMPLRFELHRIERAKGSGWYDETTRRGFSFTETVSVTDTKALKGVYVEAGNNKAEAVYGLEGQHPLCITWQDDAGIRYRAAQNDDHSPGP